MWAMCLYRYKIMEQRYYIGWSRDNNGKIVKRPVKQIANAITQATGGAHICEDGLGNTTPYVVYVRE